MSRPGFFSQTGMNIIWWDYSPRIARWNYPDRSGNFWRLYWNGSAGGEIILDGVHYPLDAGVVAVIPPMLNFSSASSGVFSHFSVHFLAPDFLRRIKRKFYFYPVGVAPFEDMPQLMAELQNKENFNELKMMRLYHMLFSLPGMFLPEDFENEQNPLTDLRILRAAEYIRDHPEEVPDNLTLSRRSEMSPGTFLRLFQQELKLSPQRYSRLKRIEKAVELLRESAISLEDVARKTGFADRYHFSRVFKQVTGVAPAAFRKKNQL